MAARTIAGWGFARSASSPTHESWNWSQTRLGILGAWTDARRIAEERHAFWAVMVEPEDTDQIQLRHDQRRSNSTWATCRTCSSCPSSPAFPTAGTAIRWTKACAACWSSSICMLPIPQLVKRGMDLVIAVTGRPAVVAAVLALGDRHQADLAAARCSTATSAWAAATRGSRRGSSAR